MSAFNQVLLLSIFQWNQNDRWLQIRKKVNDISFHKIHHSLVIFECKIYAYVQENKQKKVLHDLM